MAANMTRLSSSLGPQLAQTWTQPRSPTAGLNPANQDGFALGRLFKMVVIDPIASLFTTSSHPSKSDIRVDHIYRDRLKAFVTHLQRNFYRLHLNPTSLDARTRIEKVFTESPIWDVPCRPDLQKKILGPLKESIEVVNDPCLKHAMREILSPVLFSTEELAQAKTRDFKNWKGSLEEFENGVEQAKERCGFTPHFSILFQGVKEDQPNSISLKDLEGNEGFVFK